MLELACLRESGINGDARTTTTHAAGGGERVDMSAVITATRLPVPVCAVPREFKTIIADPPWEYLTRTIAGRDKSPDRHYSVMNMQDIIGLDVKSIAAPDATLLLWITWPHLIPFGELVMRSWGFQYVSGYPWVKLSADMIPRMGTGFHARQCSELLLIGKRGKAPAPQVEDREIGLILHKQGSHSAKPLLQYDIAKKYPGPHLSLFDRPWWGMLEPPADWVFVGNEITGRDVRDDLERLQSGTFE